MRSKPLPILLFLFTAMLMLFISVKYIPAHLKQLALERLMLTELVDEAEHRAVWLDGSTRLGLEVSPEDKACAVMWRSDDESIITVNDEGVMTGHALGSAVVTVTADSGASLSMNVEVIRKPVPSGSDLPEIYHEIPIVANGHTPIGPDLIPEDLVSIPSYLKVNKNGMKMTRETLEAYSAMAQDAERATGQALMVISGYRSYETQKRLYDEDVDYYMRRGYSREQAQIETERTTNKPGCSEHQLGNSIDIGTGPSLQYDFLYTRAGAWVTQHAHEYGFILRYPADKVDKTTIDYEAWHFRYVGKEHAKYIYEHGLCLEEYIELLHEANKAADEYAKTVTATEYIEAAGN